MKKVLRCLIVDDELLAQEVMKHLVSQFEDLEIAGVCNNVFELLKFLAKDDAIDVVFLDIKMPEIQGIEFVNIYKNPPKIVYTTAFSNYALEAFGQNAVDYLLKPISLERFSQTIDKLRGLTETSAVANNTSPSATNSFFIRSDKRMIPINREDIILVEGLGNYVTIFTEDDKYVVHSTMTQLEEQLSAYNEIVRVHKSFLVNTSKIKYIEQHTIYLPLNKIVPIGLTFRAAFYQQMGAQ